MSDEYISKAKAIEEVNCALDRETLLFSFVRKVTISALKRLPSADVAPVVRCKDCKHYYFADNRIPQEQRYVCEISGEIWKPDSFCSYGERKE